MLEQQLVNALSLGCVYALFALGFTLVFGILGVITEVSLKVVPVPVAEATLRFDGVAQHEALDRLNRWAGQPLPLSASAWADGTLHLRLSGAAAALRAARQALGGDDLAHHQPFVGRWRLHPCCHLPPAVASASIMAPPTGPAHG
jgi:glycolate oxidase FAD binding subunit